MPTLKISKSGAQIEVVPTGDKSVKTFIPYVNIKSLRVSADGLLYLSTEKGEYVFEDLTVNPTSGWELTIGVTSYDEAWKFYDAAITLFLG